MHEYNAEDNVLDAKGAIDEAVRSKFEELDSLNK
jgi:hypothetical protein